MSEPRITDEVEALTLVRRRAFMALPLEERRRQMAEQADRMLKFGETDDETAERALWQGGDIVEST
jgi:ribosomal protein S21